MALRRSSACVCVPRYLVGEVRLADASKVLFLSFPYVCPEPVLANDDFYYKIARKRRFLTLWMPAGGWTQQALRKCFVDETAACIVSIYSRTNGAAS